MGDVAVSAPPFVVVAHVAHVALPVAVVMASGLDAVTAGVPELVPNVTVGVPAAACGVSTTVPLVLPLSESVPIVPDLPRAGAAV